MSVLPDHMIQAFVENCCMIDPFVPDKRSDKGPSYGLSSAGYDCRLSDTIWIAKPGSDVIDLQNLPAMEDLFDVQKGDSHILMPGMFVLMHTVEYFRIPRSIIGRCAGKSTLRRLGKINDMTPLEPGWEGHLVVELNFTFPRPIKIYSGMGVCQVIFEELAESPIKDYNDMGGKYMYQQGVTPAR